jgi:hypothetical protein
MDNNNQKEIAELVKSVPDDFRMGMEHREQLSIRIGKRTTRIIRFGMTSMMMFGVALFYLIFILTKDFFRITTHMTAMSAQMDNMDGNVGSMTSSMHVLNNQFTDMNRTVGNMASNMNQMAKPMKVFPFQAAPDQAHADTPGQGSNYGRTAT